jgi:hypothetical protein
MGRSAGSLIRPCLQLNLNASQELDLRPDLSPVESRGRSLSAGKDLLPEAGGWRCFYLFSLGCSGLTVFISAEPAQGL